MKKTTYLTLGDTMQDANEVNSIVKLNKVKQEVDDTEIMKNLVIEIVCCWRFSCFSCFCTVLPDSGISSSSPPQNINNTSSSSSSSVPEISSFAPFR